MKKKSLIKEISSVVKSKGDVTLEKIDQLGGELYIKIFKTNFVNVLIYFVFMVLSTVFFNTIDHLSFIKEDDYYILVTIFAFISLIIAIIFFTLYIYNKKKEKQITQTQMKKTYHFYQIFDIFSFVSVFVTIFFWVILFVISPVEVSGTSMEPTYHTGDKVLVWHIFYEPKLDDVVIINSKPYYKNLGDTEFVIKRVVATGGDKVTFDKHIEDVDGHLVTYGAIYVNGVEVVKRVDITIDDYKTMLTNVNTGETFYDTGIVPEGYSIVFGDNVTSLDSKSVGLIKNEDILGISIFRIYPFDKFGIPVR